MRSFIKQMSQRVFHAGVRTAELLTIYTNIIHVFKTLDSRGVLLERVAQPLRSYLRDREDTVKVIAASFLADMDDAGQLVNASDDVCPDITQAVRMSETEDARPSKKALDFDDMEWEPDPFDAGPGTQAVEDDAELTDGRLQNERQQRCPFVHALAIRTGQLYQRGPEHPW